MSAVSQFIRPRSTVPGSQCMGAASYSTGVHAYSGIGGAVAQPALNQTLSSYATPRSHAESEPGWEPEKGTWDDDASILSQYFPQPSTRGTERTRKRHIDPDYLRTMGHSIISGKNSLRKAGRQIAANTNTKLGTANGWLNASSKDGLSELGQRIVNPPTSSRSIKVDPHYLREMGHAVATKEKSVAQVAEEISKETNTLVSSVKNWFRAASDDGLSDIGHRLLDPSNSKKPQGSGVNETQFFAMRDAYLRKRPLQEIIKLAGNANPVPSTLAHWFSRESFNGMTPRGKNVLRIIRKKACKG